MSVRQVAMGDIYDSIGHGRLSCVRLRSCNMGYAANKESLSSQTQELGESHFQEVRQCANTRLGKTMLDTLCKWPNMMLSLLQVGSVPA